MTRQLRPLVAALALALVAPVARGVPSAAAVDYLDPAFGTGGTVIFDSPARAGAAYGVAIQGDGKLLVVGGGSGLTVARFTAAGAPDTSFDGDGVATIGQGSATGVAVQTDGKIVVAGTSSLDGMPGYCCRVGIARLNANGSPDNSFGGDGFIVSTAPAIQYGGDVAIQTDGKILVSGTQNSPPFGGLFVERYNANGTPDSSFGTDGHVIENLGWNGTGGHMALQGDGKVIVAGSTGGELGDYTTDWLIARYTTDGSPDPTFDGDGYATIPFGTTGRATDVVLQSDGKVVAAGTSDGGFAVVRLTGAGALDPAFDGDGLATTTFPGDAYAASVGMQADGKIVAVGTSTSNGAGSFAIARFATDGWIDGKTTFQVEPSPNVGANQLAIQGDGKFVVVGGGACDSECAWVLARYVALPPAKSLSTTPAAVDFGTEIVGSDPAGETVTITNTGSTGVTINSFDLEAASDLGLSIGQTDCPTTLAAKSSCAVELLFAPEEEGDLLASLVIQSDAEMPLMSVPVAGVAAIAASGVIWSAKKQAGPEYTWNGGGALARTVKDETQRLHLAYSTNRVNGSWAKNTGPYVGVYYIRSTSGSTWTTPKRLNPSTQHAARLGLAASGSRVYATWVSQTRWNNYSATAPRVLYVRVNTNHGAGAAWQTTIRLTPKSGRVDYPTIAASGSDVHVAYTDAVTGDVRIASSRDLGVTWTKATVGSTSIAIADGKIALPAVAVDGSTVVVAWLSDTDGTINARVSTDHGVTWGSTITVGSQSTGALSVAVLADRMAVAWTTPFEVVVRTAVDGTWGSPKVLEELAPSEELSPYGPQVVLQGESSIAVAWSRQVPGDYTADIRWAESPNGGTLWFKTQTLASWRNARNANDWPSILWPSAGTRYVVWNGWNAFSGTYRLYLRAGSGAPVAPTIVAPTWTPTRDLATALGDNVRAAPDRVAQAALP